MRKRGMAEGAEGVPCVPSFRVSAMQVSVERGRRGGLGRASAYSVPSHFRGAKVRTAVRFDDVENYAIIWVGGQWKWLSQP